MCNRPDCREDCEGSDDEDHHCTVCNDLIWKGKADYCDWCDAFLCRGCVVTPVRSDCPKKTMDFEYACPKCFLKEIGFCTDMDCKCSMKVETIGFIIPQSAQEETRSFLTMESVRKLEQKALEFAVIKHGDQKRRDSGIPYVVHPIRVAGYVREFYHELDFYIAALLHDVLEDTDATEQEISTEFGSNVLRIVKEVTSDKEKIKEIGKVEYLRRKIEHMPPEAVFLKACDRLDNISDIHPASELHNWSRDYASQTYVIFQGQLERAKKGKFVSLLSVLQRIESTLVEKGYPSLW